MYILFRMSIYLISLDIKPDYWQMPIANDLSSNSIYGTNSRTMKIFPFTFWSTFSFSHLATGSLYNIGSGTGSICFCLPWWHHHLYAEFKKHIEDLRMVLHRRMSLLPIWSRIPGIYCESSRFTSGPRQSGCNFKDSYHSFCIWRIVGIVTRYCRCIPCFSTVLAHSTRLTQKNTPFVRDTICRKAMEQVTRCISYDPILSRFYPFGGQYYYNDTGI